MGSRGTLVDTVLVLERRVSYYLEPKLSGGFAADNISIMRTML